MVRNLRRMKMPTRLYFAAACLLLLTACSSSDGKTTASPQSKIHLLRVFPELSFSRPILMLQKPGSEDWYVLEQSGSIHRVDPRAQGKSLLLKLEQFYDISTCNEC